MNNFSNFQKFERIETLFMISLFAFVFFSNLPYAYSEFITADASGYLDIGRNIFLGKGALASYNIYQFWPGKTHCAFPYMPPIFPLIAGFIWWIWSLKAVIIFNIFLLSINCVFLYLIFRNCLERFFSFFLAVLMGCSFNFVFTALFPWTEQLHLTLLLLAIYLYLKPKNPPFFWIGVILACSFLTRTASIYNIVAFAGALVVLRGFSKNSFRQYASMLLGLGAIIFIYESFCCIVYGYFYPQYFTASTDFALSEAFPGAFYQNAFPVLHPSAIKMAIADLAKGALRNISDFIKAFGLMKFSVFIVPVAAFWYWRKKNPFFVFFFFQGLGGILGYSLGFSWFPRNIEVFRYSLVPFVMWGTLGFLILKDLLTYFFQKLSIQYAKSVFIIICAVFLFFQLKQCCLLQRHIAYLYPQTRHERDVVYNWIKQHAEPDDLVASDLLQDAFLFERPFVSLPQGKAMTEKNLQDFLAVYKPDYVLTANKKLANYLNKKDFEEKITTGRYFLLGKKEKSFIHCLRP